MLVSYNWLKEYVDIDVPAEELAEIITRAGVEIGGLTYPAAGIRGVVVAEVVSCEQHPDSDHLHLCQVSTDGDHRIQVVCGAPNVAAGQWVCFAPVGSELPGGVHIGQAELRGVTSYGMICSMQELGVSDDLVAPEDKDGIRVLPADAPLGVDVCEYLGLNDVVFELDLTPNRSDCLSVYNVAREVGALLEKPVRPLDIDVHPTGAPVADDMRVTIAAPDLCHRYVGALVRNVSDVRSPIWMEHRLQCAGIRPKSLLVDVTNYVMLETGQPLHAFDYDEIAGHHIDVRRAHADEVITTLDDQKRALTDEMLLITDEERAVGIAGVMGGENTEIRPETKNVFIESAWFEPRNIRRTSLRLGLRSEASIRNEKGLNMEGVPVAAQRAAALIERYAGGAVAPESLDVYPTPHAPVEVRLRYEKCNALLGTDLDPSFMVGVLRRLQFAVIEENESSVLVQVPPYRPDVRIEEDLIEEVARLYGYDHIPSTLPYGSTHTGRLTEVQRLRRAVETYLVNRGLHQIISYSFINRDAADRLRLAADDAERRMIPLDNPLNEELAVMRTTLLPSLLDAVQANGRRGTHDLAIFEQGRIYCGEAPLAPETLADERERLGIVLCGRSEGNWQTAQKPYDFYVLKGLVEGLCQSLALPVLRFEPLTDHPSWHPGRTANVYVGEAHLGVIGEVHPSVSEAWDIKQDVYIAELKLEVLFAQGIVAEDVSAPPRYPAVLRDLALVVSEEVPQQAVADAIRSGASALLQNVTLFDVYQGAPLEAGSKSLAYALRFQSDEATLTDAIIDGEMAKITELCAARCGAHLRA